MKVTMVYADRQNELNCSFWNVLAPVAAINKLNPVHSATAIPIDQFVKNDADTQKLINESDIVVVERNFFQDVMVIIAFWISKGKPVIGIFDDAYNLEERDNASYGFWRHARVNQGMSPTGIQFQYMNPHPLVQFKMTLGLLKGLQLVSTSLCNDWSPYVPTYYVPNFITLSRYENARPLYPTDGKVVIGWAGSLNHLAPFQQSGLLDALSVILDKYPQVVFLCGGDERVFNALAKYPYNRRIYHPFVPETQYASLLRTFHIALAPLATEFDRRRSRVKAMEYSYLKVPWIASNFPPYEEFAFTGNLVENNKDAWVEAISNRIENLPAYQERANGNIYEYALGLDIDKNIQNTLDLYQTIIDAPYPDKGVK